MTLLGSGSPTAGQTYPHVRNPWLYFSSIHQQPGHLPDASTLPSCSLHAVLAVSEVGGGAASRTSSSLGLAFLCGEKPVAQHHGWPGLLSDCENGKEPACQCRRHKTPSFDPWVGKIPWRRAWLPTPPCLPGESHGQRSLTDYSRWGHKGSNTTEMTKHSHTQVDDKGTHMSEGCRERWQTPG